jgi:hypothetical protein
MAYVLPNIFRKLTSRSVKSVEREFVVLRDERRTLISQLAAAGRIMAESYKAALAIKASRTHYIATKDGTSLETFKAFIQELDGGVGKSWSWEILGAHAYLTEIDPEDAADLPMGYDFISRIHPPLPFDESYDGSHVEEWMPPSGGRCADCEAKQPHLFRKDLAQW